MVLLASLMVLLLLPLTAFSETKAPVIQPDQPIAEDFKTLKKRLAPDLVVSNINMSPAKPNTNNTITVWTFVKNVGSTASPTSSLQLQIGGKIYPLITVPALPVNKEWRNTTVIEPLTAGNYRITAIVNPQKQTTESQYDNNQQTKSFTVVPGPSVFIQNITWDRSSKMWVATVKNAASAPARIGVAGFPLENGVPGMTKWANTTLTGHGTYNLIGDYSGYAVPAGTRLKVHVINKSTNAVIDEQVIELH